MKTLSFILGLIVTGSSMGTAQSVGGKPGEQFGALWRWHFVGSAALAQDTNAAYLKKIFNMPTSGKLRREVLGKLAKTPHQFWLGNLPAGVPDQSALFRPLLDDLTSAESFWEVQGPTNRAEMLLAVALPDQRASLWRTNLWQVMLGWKLGVPTEVTLQGSKGWEVKRSVDSKLVRFLRVGQWVVIDVGPDTPTLLPTRLKEVATGGRPSSGFTNAWLEVQADWPALRGWIPLLADYRLPPTHLTINGKGESLRTKARFYFPEKVSWSSEAWRFPTNRINEPINSFTVGRGLAPFWKQVNVASEPGIEPLPSQFCLWDRSGGFVRSILTVPVEDPTNRIIRLASTLPKFIQSHLGSTVRLNYLTNRSQLVLEGLPVMSPSIALFRQSGVNYLLGSLLPSSTSTNMAPAELFTQLGRADLAYYDWEITQEKVVHARQILQVVDMANHRKLPQRDASSQEWLVAVGPHLGNTATEISVSGPKELTLIRKSHIGLTGFELVALTRWLDSPNFPLQYQPPPLLPDPQSMSNRVRRASSPTNTVDRATGATRPAKK